MFKGDWWYGRCLDSNLNGQHLRVSHGSEGDGIEWETWKGVTIH